MDKKIEQALQDMSSLKFAVRESAKNLIRHELDVRGKMIEKLIDKVWTSTTKEKVWSHNEIDNIYRTIAEKEVPGG